MELVSEYITGQSATIDLYETDCDATGNCNFCSAKIDGALCKSCSIQTCDDGSRNERIDCTNYNEDATLDFCDKDGSSSGPIFDAFVEFDYWKCYPLQSFKKEMKSRQTG